MMPCSRLSLFGTEEARHDALWLDVRGGAADSEIAAHFDSCPGCQELRSSFIRLDRGLKPGATVLAVCPPAAVLSAFAAGEPAGDGVANHLVRCPVCRDEVEWLKSSAQVRPISRRAWFGGAAAAVAAGSAWVFLRPPANRYAAAADVPPLDEADLLSTVSSPEVGARMQDSLAKFRAGRFAESEAIARELLASAPQDPSAAFTAGMALYRQGRLSEAASLIAASERMQPMTHYRCWVALQFALLTGDGEAIDRECRHVGADPIYADRVSKIKLLRRN